MKLSDYLEQNKLTPIQFGRLIGVKSRMTAIRYAKGERVPERAIMARIYEVTGGAVAPNDFLLPVARPKGRRAA